MFKIKEVTKADTVLGGSVESLMPKMDDIPNDIKQGRTKWNKVTTTWFFRGLSNATEFYPKEGVVVAKAIAHIRAILASFEPKHEEKEAAVAFLLSEWFHDIKKWE